MNSLNLFLPVAAGVEGFLLEEVERILAPLPAKTSSQRGGVQVVASWREMMKLNLHARLPQRVLIQLRQEHYQNEADIYEVSKALPWELWFTERQTFKVEITAQYSPLKSLNFAALKVKDAVADRFRERTGIRPDVDVRWPHVRIYVHLTQDTMTLSLDTSGEPLFKRGWRLDKGEAPLKETLAAAMLAAVGWTEDRESGPACLYDPCCGSGTIAIEAAQIECAIAPGQLRRFGFEHLIPHQAHAWHDLKDQAKARERSPQRPIYGSDVSFRMVDFAQNNAERAGVASAIEFRGGDALQRMPPCEQAGVLLLNPPYDERIQVAGVAGTQALARGHRGQREQFDHGQASDEQEEWQEWEEREEREEREQREQRAQGGRSDLGDRTGARERAQTDNDEDFFQQLASHWKKNFSSWSAWILTPNLKLPGQMRLKESRRVPLWNGPIECRLFRFDMVRGKLKPKAPEEGHEA